MPGYASAAGPRPAEAVRALREAGAARVVVATYLLAPGYFADKIRDAALDAGATAVSRVLGAAPEVADVVLDRYLAALAEPPAAVRTATRFEVSPRRRGPARNLHDGRQQPRPARRWAVAIDCGQSPVLRSVRLWSHS